MGNIVGIDPGTTAGLAILDHRGRIVSLLSGRDLGRDDLIRLLSEHGVPLVIGTDKAKVPHLVRDVAVKTGARLHLPASDMGEDEKRLLTAQAPTANAHERDALAAAMVAYRAHASLLSRIERTARDQHVDLDELMGHVLRNEASITDALEAMRHEEPTRTETAPQPTPQNINKLRAQARTLRTDNALLREQVRRLQRRLADATRQLERAETKTGLIERRERRRVAAQLRHKDTRAKHLEQKLTRAEERAVDTDRRIGALLEKAQRHLLVPALHTLSDRVTIPDSAHLYVENINVIGPKTAARLNQRGTRLISPVKATAKTRSQLRLTIIDGVRAEVVSGHALIHPDALARRSEDTSHLKDVVRAYQRDRR